jgi:hypothetical protein
MIRLFLGLLLIFSLPAEPAPNAKEELTQLPTGADFA